MKWHYVGVVVAVIGAGLHVAFAYLETLGWGPGFVNRAAPSWMKRLNEDPITWAGPLAINVGVYNLALAIGLAWTCWAFYQQQAIAGLLGLYFAIWLLLAAAAAFHTKVYLAFALQGFVGLVLLSVALLVVAKNI